MQAERIYNPPANHSTGTNGRRQATAYSTNIPFEERQALRGTQLGASTQHYKIDFHMNKSVRAENKALMLTGSGDGCAAEFVIFDVGKLTGRQPTRADCLPAPQSAERPS